MHVHDGGEYPGYAHGNVPVDYVNVDVSGSFPRSFAHSYVRGHDARRHGYDGAHGKAPDGHVCAHEPHPQVATLPGSSTVQQ